MKKAKKEAKKEENIRSKDRYQQEIKLFFKEKKVIEDEITNIGLVIKEKEVELKKINEEKYLYNIEKEKIEKEERESVLLDERREAEEKRWELEKKIVDIVDIELEIGEIIFKKKAQLKEISIQYNLLKEKILKMEERLVLMNNEIKDISLIEKLKKEIKKEKDKNQEISSLILTEKEKKDRLDKVESFFELFYKKIWLMVVVLDNDEKKVFKKIILSGGADFIPKMTEYIQTKINQKLPNVMVKIADPSININDSSLLKRPKKISQFSNAIGAALKGFKN